MMEGCLVCDSYNSCSQCTPPSYRHTARSCLLCPPRSRSRSQRTTTQKRISGQYEQQFYKYSTMNPPVEGNFGGVESNQTAVFRNTTSNIVSPPPPQPQPLPSTNTNTLNFNSQGYSSSIQGKPWEMAPPAPTTTTSQFARPYSSIQGSTQVVTSTSVQGGTGGSSDFLRRIDEQLQASRKQFPSS